MSQYAVSRNFILEGVVIGKGHFELLQHDFVEQVLLCCSLPADGQVIHDQGAYSFRGIFCAEGMGFAD